MPDYNATQQADVLILSTVTTGTPVDVSVMAEREKTLWLKGTSGNRYEAQ